MQTTQERQNPANEKILSLDPERALPETGSDHGDLMAYASEIYKALQLSKQREEKLTQQLLHAEGVSQKIGEASLSQYKQAAEHALDRAKLLKKAALESGSSEDLMRADEDYMTALQNKAWAEQMMKSTPSHNAPGNEEGETPSGRQRNNPSDMDPRASAFLRKNPMIDPLSEAYDPQKHEEVATYAMALEMNLQNSGRGHEICSPAYFKKIEDYMKARFKEERQAGQKDETKKESEMNKTGENSKPTIKPLSEDEKNICKLMNIKEEDYLKHREECNRESEERRNAGERYA